MRFAVCPRTPRSSMLLVLALLGALAGAAPAASNPFAGTYWSQHWSISISGGGRVSGSYYAVWPIGPLGGYTREWGEMRGRVSADGAMSVSVTVKSTDWTGQTSRYKYELSGQATLDADGSLVLVTDEGSTFTWYRG